jgi:hypothetical protein
LEEWEVFLRARRATLEQAIAAILERLRGMPSTPRTRELRARAHTYRWAVERWASDEAPSTAQGLALRELVDELCADSEAAHPRACSSYDYRAVNAERPAPARAARGRRGDRGTL